MGIETQQYIRKPLYVDAVRVTAKNFDEVAAWCQGDVRTEERQGTTKKFIHVRVNHPKVPRQTQAFVGDWLLYTERGGYKVYTNKAFRTAFDLVGQGVTTPPTPIEEVAAPEEKPVKSSMDIVRENIAAMNSKTNDVEKLRAERENAQVDAAVEKAEEGIKQITEAELHSVGPVAEEPNPETGVQPIEKVDESLEDGETYYPPPTPAITPPADTDREARLVTETSDDGKIKHEPVDPSRQRAEIDAKSVNKPPYIQGTSERMRVLTEKEQREMTHHEVQQLLRSGEAILEQDLVA